MTTLHPHPPHHAQQHNSSDGLGWVQGPATHAQEERELSAVRRPPLGRGESYFKSEEEVGAVLLSLCGGSSGSSGGGGGSSGSSDSGQSSEEATKHRGGGSSFDTGSESAWNSGGGGASSVVLGVKKHPHEEPEPEGQSGEDHGDDASSYRAFKALKHSAAAAPTTSGGPASSRLVVAVATSLDEGYCMGM